MAIFFLYYRICVATALGLECDWYQLYLEQPKEIEFLNGYSQGEKAFDLELVVISSSSMLFKNTVLVEKQVPSAHTEAEYPRAWVNSTCEEDCPQSMSMASPPALLE